MLNLVYNFDYNGSKRVVLVTEEKRARFGGQNTFTGWSFTDDEFRTFKVNKVENPKNVTSSVVVLDYEEDLEERYSDKGYETFVREDFLGNEILYVVDLKEKS